MGLSPQYYDECTDDVLNLYAELEDRIIADVVRRIIKTGDITETAKWQIRQAQQMGLLYDDIIKDVAQYTSKTDSEVKKMFENAGVETVSNDNRIHLLAGNSPLDIRQSESMLQILNAVYKERLTDLKNLTGTTAITSQTAYYNACNSAFMMVSSGAFSYQQALRTVIQEVAENGTTVTYPSGHVDRLDVAVRRSLLTGIGLASRQISEENSRLCGCDLMEISAHSGARPSHAAWQGQIVSLSGRKGYLSKSDIGYGTGAGFGGWNCRHDWYPFYEGISSHNYSKKDLEKLNAKDIEYKGKMYSEYEISQMLRKKEREIRSLKREKTAYNTAIMETSDKRLKSVFKSALTYTNSAIRDKSAEIKQFCADTGYKRDRFREQVGGKTSVGHGYGEFSKQNQKFNLKNGLTSAKNSGRIKNIKVPENEILRLKGMTKDTQTAISKAIEKMQSQYNIDLKEIVITPLGKGFETTPFQYNPKNVGGYLSNQLIINSDYYFEDSLEDYEARIMKNYNRGVLASKKVEDLIAHEMAHIMTFQECKTYGEFIALEEEVRSSFVRGVTAYADDTWDGAETIAEAFVKLRNGEAVPDKAKQLVEKYVERWKKK